MKPVPQFLSRTALFLSILFVNAGAIAQSKDLNVDVNVNKGGAAGGIGNYWMWIVGAAVFILILVAVLRGGRKTD